MPCDEILSLVQTMSKKKPCVLGTSFGLVGCDATNDCASSKMSCRGSTTMWISNGCRGKFSCLGNLVTCGHTGIVYRTPTHNCTCAPMHVGGTFLAKTGTPSPTLPKLASYKGHPRLHEARQGHPRFVPGSANDTLAATFAMWNLLDATMHAHSIGNFQTGYVRELQVRRMIDLARQPKLLRAGGTYCEIGFNGGHSAVAMLLANPRLVVHSFDLMAWKYSEPAVNLLQIQWPKRFHMHKGDSLKTVPAWTSENAASCDIIFVDGDHSTKGAWLDMRNMREAAAPGAICLADDINSKPGEALESLAAHRVVDILESFGPFEAPSPNNPCMRAARSSPYCLTWGFALYSYRGGPASVPKARRFLGARNATGAPRGSSRPSAS